MLAFVTACSHSEGGTPMPGTAAPTTESTSTRPSSGRPREIKLDGKDPCQLLTAEQLPSLKIDRPGRPGNAPAFKAKDCSWTVTGADSRLAPVTSEGIEVWTGGKRTGQAEQTEPIATFPAISVTVPSDQDRCDVAVDVADGQYLLATFSVSPSFRDRFPKPCDGARQLAEAAMQNLVK
ncbi:DUF3558 domain-containing protein [Lentzea nigeriaca]|uniref:DUF3558 domain-containing protein n=1 Tax=Lentzea nigeriaca TaxID=1128665 RepID=UPI0023BA68A4|nr:DUF3558 domain-containing protein [Lentzea nigeriaca]